MSKSQRTQRAFFSSLCEYNETGDTVDTLKVGLIAALLGESSQRHIERYYPECARG